MDIDAVIAAGQFGLPDILAGMPWDMWVLPLIYLGLAAIAMLVSYRYRGWSLAVLALLLLGAGVLKLDESLRATREALIERWRMETAYPYIAALPDETRTITAIRLKPSSVPTDQTLYPTGAEERQLAPLEVVFEEGGEPITLSAWLEVASFADARSPYILFKRLDRDLGNGVEAGIYYPRVILPAKYPLRLD